MKVETVLMVDGKQVEKVFQNGEVVVYQHDLDESGSILFFVSNRTQKVLFKQKIIADCSQNVGFISNIYFTGVGDEN